MLFYLRGAHEMDAIRLIYTLTVTFLNNYLIHIYQQKPYISQLCSLAVEEGCVGDKLQCIGCKARLGSFNWAGMQCNCGAWIIPAFQLHKSRIDECRL